MKILHVSDVYLPRLGGIERQVADLADQQRRRGHDVVVATSTQGAATDDGRTVQVPLTGGRARQLIDDLAPDVVHCHSSIVSPLAWSFARSASSASVPVVLTMHSVAQAVGPVRSGLRAVAGLIGPAAVWTSVSAMAAAALEPAVRVPVHVVNNGVDPAQWTRSRAGQHAVPTVVSVMRLAARKRPLAYVEMLAAVHRELGPDVRWRAVIAGTGPQEDAVRRAVRRHGLADVVTLAGRLDRAGVGDLLTGADLYVAPALLESFGIAALEARCAAVPVVALRGAGVSEFVHDGVEGHLVDDDADMARTVAALVRSPERLRELSAGCARSPVAQAWPTVVDRCLELYDVAACQTARPPALLDVH